MVRIEFGYGANRDGFCCAKRVTTGGWMLCGARLSSMPIVQPPFPPGNLCPGCRRVLDGGLEEFAPPVDEQAEGTCPACVGRVPLDEAGLIAAHGEWSYRGGQLVVTDRPCAGRGELPEVEQ